MSLGKYEIINTIESGCLAASAAGDPEWVGATDALLYLYTNKGLPFSSGELAALLRTYRSDLRFSVTTSIGQHLRNRYWDGTLPKHETDAGIDVDYVAVTRITQGWSRTPSGESVFVYGLTVAEAESHEFEVDIPQPGAKLLTESDGFPKIPQQPVTPMSSTFTTTPKPNKPKDMSARVHTDGRLCVPRHVVEVLMHAESVQSAHQDVWVHEVGDELHLSYTQKGTTDRSYSPQQERGRLLVRDARFVPGTEYALTLTDSGLVIDLG